MSTISASSSVTTQTAPRNEAPAQSQNSSTASSRVEVSSSQPVNGNSASATVAAPSDNVSVINRASAISTNDNVNRVLSDVLGPRNESGNSATGSLQIRADDGSRPVSADDPAAPYRATEKQPLEGYDATKLANPEHKTPKYIFGRVAQNFKLDSVQGDKSKAEDILKAMLPEMQAAGLEVVAVKGDRIQVKTELGYEWVDVIRGAGDKENKPGWHWGSEGKGTPNPTATVAEWAAQTGQGGGAEPAGAAPAGGGGGAAPAGGGGGAAPAGAAAGPKYTPLGNQIDESKVRPILEKYDVLDIEKAVADPEIQAAYPGAKVIPHPKRLDKIEFPNGAIVDCVIGAGAPGAKWGWGPEN